MRKYLKRILFIMLFAGSATSCNKYLELRPPDGITRDIFWKSKEQILSAVIGCYTAMQVVPSGKTPTEMFFVWGELRADMIAPGLGMGDDELSIVNNNILATNPFVDWRNIYRVINFCNTVIQFAPEVKATDATLTDKELNGYLGEALAIRALMYFYLARTFGDVPLKIRPTSSDSEIGSMQKSTQMEVFAQVLTDLKLAENYALESYGTNIFDKGRVTKYTVYAIEADVYLWQDNYTESIAAADKIIASGRFALVPGNSAWFNTLYGTGNSVEGIFELQFDVQVLNPFYGMFTTSRRRYLAGPEVLNSIYTLDLVNENRFDVRGINAAVRSSDQSVYKYLGINSETARSQDASYANWIFYRYADVLLMKAEACAYAGRGQDALNLIAQIRSRANALTSSAESPAQDDVDGVIDYILNERARELAFEGKRWYDLLRTARHNNYARMDILRSAALKSVPSGNQQSALNKLKDPYSHYLPIYYYDIQADPQLIQNPFYK